MSNRPGHCIWCGHPWAVSDVHDCPGFGAQRRRAAAGRPVPIRVPESRRVPICVPETGCPCGADPHGQGWLCRSCFPTLPPENAVTASDEDLPGETEQRWSICTDCGMWDLVAGLRDPLCTYCGELRTLPPGRLMSRRTRRPLIAATWACAVAATALIWLVPAFARIVSREVWPLDVLIMFLVGWQARGRRHP